MLKFQYFSHLMQKADSLEKTLCWERLKAGGEGNNRGWDSWMASLILWAWVWAGSGNWWWTRQPGMLQSMRSQSDTTKQLNWLIECYGLNCVAISMASISYFEILTPNPRMWVFENRLINWVKKWSHCMGSYPVSLTQGLNAEIQSPDTAIQK